MALNDDEQMTMVFMAEDKDVDPVSGNEVPPGSLPEEVRDDIPAQLSEGEYVVPADVLRFYGMKFFEDLRKNAKIELAQMEANGRIGGQPVDAAVGGYITGQPTQATMSDPYKQQQMMYRQGAPVAMGNAGYAPGGTVSLNPYGNPINNPFTANNQIANTASNTNTGVPKPIIKDGMTYMPPSDFYVGSSLFGPAPSLQPPFTPVTLYGPNGEIVTANTQAEYDDYISKDYKTTQTITEEEPIVTGSDNDDINQEVESLTTISQQAERDAYAENFESALAGTASDETYIDLYNNLSTQQATLTGMSAINPIAAPVILKTLSDKKKINAALEKKYGADWKTNPKYADLAAKLKAIDDRSFTDKLKDAFTSGQETQGDTYTPEYSVYGLSMGGEMPTVEAIQALPVSVNLSETASTGNYITLLSPEEQRAYDRAVQQGRGTAARHYAIINAARVRRLLEGKMTEKEQEQLGLNKTIDPVSSPSTSTSTGPGSGAASSQATAQSILDALADPSSETATETAQIIANSLNTAGEGATAEERIANQQNTIENLNQIVENLESATQNPSGTISLKEGGLASKPKKKKNKK